MWIQLIAKRQQTRLSDLRLSAKQALPLFARLLPLLDAEVQTAPHEENEKGPHHSGNHGVPGHDVIRQTQNEASCAAGGNGCAHGSRGCLQLKSHPELRLPEQPTADRAQGETRQEHKRYRDELFIDRHSLSQEKMN